MTNKQIRELCKGVHCLDLGESFPTSIYLQKSASIQPGTSLSKFGGQFSSLFIRLLNRASSDAPSQLFRRTPSQLLRTKRAVQKVQKRVNDVNLVDLVKSFQTCIYCLLSNLQKSASIQPRTSPSKFGGKIQFNIHFTPYMRV